MSFLKGHCHEHRLKNSRVQKHILQQRKPTNPGPVLIKNCNSVLSASVIKLKKVLSLRNIPPGAQHHQLLEWESNTEGSM